MPKFKVELERPAANNKAVNPFARRFIADTDMITMRVRSWEFDADDEAHVRRLLKEAQEADLPEIRGFTLRSIEEVPK